MKGNYDALMGDVKANVSKLDKFIENELKPQSTTDNDLVAAALITTGLLWMAHKCHLPVSIAVQAVIRMVGAAYGVETKVMKADMPHKDPAVLLN